MLERLEKWTNYTAFGATMPGRSFTSASYRYGFNGKELDPEGMGGGGSTYDYGFRIYNPNLGRFLSVDPLTKEFPFYTPYQFSGNKAIACLDLDGLEDIYYNDPRISRYKSYTAALNVMTSTDAYNGFLKNLKGANAVDVVIAYKDYAGTEIDPFSGAHTGGKGGVTETLKKDEIFTSAFQEAEGRGINLSRSTKKGRDIIIVYVEENLLTFGDYALNQLSKTPYMDAPKSNPIPFADNYQIAQTAIEEIVNVILHELLTHTTDELDGKDDVETAQEHIDFYGPKPYQGKDALDPSYYSPGLRNVDPDSPAGKIKQEVKGKTSQELNKVIKK